MNKELIPICQARDISNGYIHRKRYQKLRYDDDDDIDLRLCWEYFDSDCRCYCLELKPNDTIEDNLYNLFNFQLSFNELLSSEDGKKIFTLKNEKQGCMASHGRIYYVSDASGFAMILLSGVDLRVCYYDFDQNFTCHVKILSPDVSRKDYQLSCKSIWIVSYIPHEGCIIDVINIKNEKEWYHVRSKCNFTFELSNVFSDIMFLGSNSKDHFGDGRNIFSSCKALYIDYCNLIPKETNEKSFMEFYKPKELEKEDIVIRGIFKTTIIVTAKTHLKFCYSLTYNERLDLEVCKRVDLTGYFDKKIRDIGMLKFLPQIGKMLVSVSPTYMVVIDLKILQITQILESPEGLFDLEIRWSKEERMLNMVCSTGQRLNEYFLLKYVLYNRQSLKELALNSVLDNFSLEEIEAFNLPQSLIQEIMTRKIH